MNSGCSYSVGIIGGAGAIASARFHLDFVKTWAKTHNAKTDDDFPTIKHISQHLHLTERGVTDEDLTEAAVTSVITSLLGENLTRIAVVCNSITRFIPNDSRFLTPVQACQNSLKHVKQAWLLASDSTLQDKIYQTAYPHIAWNPVSITLEIQQIMAGGTISLESFSIPEDDTIVLGCTELSTINFNRPNLVSPTEEMIKILCQHEPSSR